MAIRTVTRCRWGQGSEIRFRYDDRATSRAVTVIEVVNNEPVPVWVRLWDTAQVASTEREFPANSTTTLSIPTARRPRFIDDVEYPCCDIRMSI